jgi:hypothetical protein
LINELDSDQTGTDAAEFVELFGNPNEALDGFVVVFFNGSSDLSYAAFDLDTFSTDSGGYFVLGNVGVPNVGLTFAGNFLQNGADAVALYMDDAASFPNDTPPTATNLVDALVYDTNDADDPGLLAVFGGSQIDEGGSDGNSTIRSIARLPNGTGAFTDTTTITPGTENVPEPMIGILLVLGTFGCAVLWRLR